MEFNNADSRAKNFTVTLLIIKFLYIPLPKCVAIYGAFMCIQYVLKYDPLFVFDTHRRPMIF